VLIVVLLGDGGFTAIPHLAFDPFQSDYGGFDAA
jgi:hypothetical protein